MFGKKEPDLAELERQRHADPANDCPQWRAPCRKHACRWYVQILGHNPNTGVQENKSECAIAWLPILQIETSQQARQAGASADKVATEVRKFHNKMVQMNQTAIHQQKIEALLEDAGGRENGRGT